MITKIFNVGLSSNWHHISTFKHSNLRYCRTIAKKHLPEGMFRLSAVWKYQFSLLADISYVALKLHVFKQNGHATTKYTFDLAMDTRTFDFLEAFQLTPSLPPFRDMYAINCRYIIKPMLTDYSVHTSIWLTLIRIHAYYLRYRTSRFRHRWFWLSFYCCTVALLDDVVRIASWGRSENLSYATMLRSYIAYIKCTFAILNCLSWIFY